MGEAINLVNDFKVDNVIFNHNDYNDLELELIEMLKNKKINYFKDLKQINIYNNKLYFLNNSLYTNENDNSSVIYFEVNGIKSLLMGDAGIKVENNILNNYNLSNIDILKVGHHGSKTSSSENFINKINPKYSVISVGKNNWYGHPDIEVLDNLNNSIIYRTDICGSVRFKLENEIKINKCLQ